MDPPPKPSSRSPSTSSSPPPPQPTLKQRAQIKTHHCRFCSHLLLATTQDLASLPRRREPAGDRAIILPLPENGGGEDEDDEDESGDEEEEEEEEEEEVVENEGEGEEGSARRASPTQRTDEKEKDDKGKGKEEAKGESQSQSQPQKHLHLHLLRKHYTILLSTTLPDRKHTVIRREDGFEKRLLLRCGRCRVVVGYVLDEEAHRVRPTLKGAAGGEKENEKDGRAKVVYILPGALVGTEEMGGEDVKVEKEEWAKWIKS